MALGSTTTSAPRLAPINPANLVSASAPVVESRAAATLTDAFRQGVITADDIISRVGELGKAKDKAQLQVATEFTSPEAVTSRAAQVGATTEQAELAEAKALRAQVLQEFPAVAYFDQLAPAAGIVAPKLPDGTPDYKQMEVIGAQLALDKAKKLSAQTERENIAAHFDAENQVVSAFTKQGAPVDPRRVRELDRIINTPFSAQAPGTTAAAPPTQSPAAPVVEARSAAGSQEDIGIVGARLAGTFGVDAIAGMDETHLRRLDASERTTVQPRAAAPLSAVAEVSPRNETPPLGAPVTGGYSLGGAKKQLPVKGPTEAQQRAQLALARFSQAGDMQAALKEAGYDPTSIGSWMNSMLPQILKDGDRKQYEAATDAWSQGLLRLESGAAISPQEKSWYGRSFFPQVKDPENVVLAKEAMRKDLERMVAEIAQAGGVVSPESAEQTRRIYERANNLSQAKTTGASRPAAPGAAPVVPLSTGRKVTRDKNGNYVYVD